MSPSPLLKTETGPIFEKLFCSYLEFRTMDTAHKASDSEVFILFGFLFCIENALSVFLREVQ
jgi:hypothetical protein